MAKKSLSTCIFKKIGIKYACMEEVTLTLSSILNKIKEDLKLPNSLLAAALSCDESTISRYLSNKTNMSIDKGIILKGFLKSNYDIDIYRDYIFNFEDDGYYFHGSRQGIKGPINPNYSNRKNTDFSRGFYSTVPANILHMLLIKIA